MSSSTPPLHHPARQSRRRAARHADAGGRQYPRGRVRRLDHVASGHRRFDPGGAPRRRVATVAVNAFQFKEPVFVGDLLSFYAAIVKTGNTSITVSVEVYAERQRLDAEVVKVTEAVLTYVATDEARRSRPYPNFEP